MAYGILTYKNIHGVEVWKSNGNLRRVKVVNDTLEIVTYRRYTSWKQVPKCVIKFMENNEMHDISHHREFGQEHFYYGGYYMLDAD